MKWVSLSAPDQLTAEMWLDLLGEKGIPATIKAEDATSFLGVSTLPCRVMVPEDKLDEAKEVLKEYLSPS